VYYRTVSFITLCLILALSLPGAASEPADKNISLKDIAVLDLDMAKEIALKNSPTLAAAKARFRQAQEQVRQFRGAYLPRLDVNAGYSYVDLAENLVFGGSSTFGGGMGGSFGSSLFWDDRQERYSASASVSWLVFNGFAREYNYAAAKHGEAAGKAARDETKRALLTSVSAIYHGAQLARENIAIAEADEVFNRRLLEDVRRRRRLGAGSLSDELNFQIQVNAAKGALIEAQKAYATALSSLAILLGIPEESFSPTMELKALEEEKESELALPEAAPLFNRALQKRPDLAVLNQRLSQVESSIGGARAAFYPSITLSAALNGERKNDIDFDEDDFGTSLSLNLTYNLFDGGAGRARLSELKLKRVEARAQKKALEIEVRRNIEKAIAELDAAQRQLKLQKANLALVKQNRDLVEKSYRFGQASLVRLNEAQKELVKAKSRLALARVTLKQAWENLRAQTGEILSID